MHSWHRKMDWIEDHSGCRKNKRQSTQETGFPLFYWQKKSRTFPGLSKTPWKIFQDLFGARECLNIKKKRHLLTIFRVQSIAENSACSKMCYTIAACFPFEPLEKCMTFKVIFPGLSRTLSFNFQDFPGQKSDFPGLSRSWNFQEKILGLSRIFQEAWEPCGEIWPIVSPTVLPGWHMTWQWHKDIRVF